MTDQSASAVLDTALPAQTPPTAGAGLRMADCAVWMLVAASPIVFAAITWPVTAFELQGIVRHFSLPIVATELVVILFAIGVGFGLREAIAPAPAWTKVALAILGVVAFGTALAATADPLSAKVRTITSLLHLLFGLSLVYLLSGLWRSLCAMVWPSIVLGTLGYLFLVAAMVVTIQDPHTFDWVRFYLGVTHVRQVGFYSVVGAAAAFGLALTTTNNHVRWAWLGATGALLALSFWSGTRSSLVAFVAACALGTATFRELRSIAAVRALAISLLAGLALGLLHRVPHPVFGPLRLWRSSGGENPDSGRIEMWLGTLQVFGQKPLFGFGESQFRFLVPEAGGGFNHPHNWVVQILFQWGVIGAACYFALAAFLLHRFHNSCRAIGAAALPAFLVATSLLVYSLYEGTLYHPYPVAMLTLAIAWTAARGRQAARSGQ